MEHQRWGLAQEGGGGPKRGWRWVGSGAQPAGHAQRCTAPGPGAKWQDEDVDDGEHDDEMMMMMMLMSRGCVDGPQRVLLDCEGLLNPLFFRTVGLANE